MCKLNLVEVQCVTVKLLTVSHNKNSRKYAKAITFKMSVVVYSAGEQLCVN